MEKLSPSLEHILRHATADGSGTRNAFCTEDGNPECERLVAAELMRRGQTLNDGQDRYYRATERGIAVAKDAFLREQKANGLKRYRVTVNLGYPPPRDKHVAVVWAKTRSAARWRVVNDMLDASDERVEVLLKLILRVVRD